MTAPSSLQKSKFVSFDYSKHGANKLLKSGKSIRALKYFSEALQYKPLNVDCLVNRSVCYMNDGFVDKAHIDANLAYKTEPTNPKAIFQKAEVHFIKGEFETALLFYHRGQLLRPDDDKFRIGIQRAETGLKNCVGDKKSFPVNSVPMSPNFLKTGSITSSMKTSQSEIAMSSQEFTNKDTIKELLHEISNDRTYLENLIREEELRILKLKDTKPLVIQCKKKNKIVRNCFCNYFNAAANQKDFNSKRIKSTAEHCMKYLEPRIEFWQQHKPFYTRQKRKMSRIFRLKLSEKEKFEWNIHSLLLEFVHIEMLEFQGDYLKAIEKAKKMTSVIGDIYGLEKHNYKIVLSDLYSVIGNCYMKLGLYSESLIYHELDRENGLKYNIKDAISRSMDYMGIIYFTRYEFQKAIDIWTEKLKLAVSNIELSWLYHEISRSHYAIGNAENALKYAALALDKANLGMDETLQLNASILLGKINFHLSKFTESTEMYIRALEISKILKLTAVEEELNKLIQENMLKPRTIDRSSALKSRESLKMGSPVKALFKSYSSGTLNSSVNDSNFTEKTDLTESADLSNKSDTLSAQDNFSSEAVNEKDDFTESLNSK